MFSDILTDSLEKIAFFTNKSFCIPSMSRCNSGEQKASYENCVGYQSLSSNILCETKGGKIASISDILFKGIAGPCKYARDNIGGRGLSESTRIPRVFLSRGKRRVFIRALRG